MNQQNVRGSEILTHRTCVLCKSCQIILWLKQIHVSLKRRQKVYILAVLCQQQNVTHISSAQKRISYFSYQECRMHVRTYAYAYSQNLEKKYIDFFYFLKAFLSLNRDKYFALYWCFCVRISFISWLSGVKWIRIGSHRPWLRLDQANSHSIPELMSRAVITLLTYRVPLIHRWAWLQRYEETATPLRRNMTDERLSSLAILHMSPRT